VSLAIVLVVAVLVINENRINSTRSSSNNRFSGSTRSINPKNTHVSTSNRNLS
jgi:hypothetical protein